MLESFSDTTTAISGRTNATQHAVTLSDNKPVRIPQHPIPLHYVDAVKSDLKQLLDIKTVEYSMSAFSVLILPVRKRDGSLRLWFDYRKLNAVTLIQQEPMPTHENMFHRLAKDKYFSKFDLTKCYYQICMHHDSKHVTSIFRCKCATSC